MICPLFSESYFIATVIVTCETFRLFDLKQIPRLEHLDFNLMRLSRCLFGTFRVAEKIKSARKNNQTFIRCDTFYYI
ncbi:hypothetical protein PSPO_b1394 [Pseudoalteromonas spongiae UST010723-006]|nr:hypothetical protein PSPO_b1394 [Pseudoalteromonas spongiae UST010723-006]